MFLVAARSAQWLACCFCPFPAVSCRISRSTAAICAYPCVTVLLLHLRRNLCGSVHSQPLSSQSLPWISRVNFIGARLWPWGTTWTVDTWTVPFAESMRALVAYSHTLAGWSDCDGLFVCRKRSSCHQIMSKQRWNPEKTEVPRVAVAIYFFRLASPFVSAWQRPLLQVSFRAAHPRRQQDASSARGALASICMHVRTKRRGSKHKRFCLRILLWQLLFLVAMLCQPIFHQAAPLEQSLSGCSWVKSWQESDQSDCACGPCCDRCSFYCYVVCQASIKLPRWNSLCQVVGKWRGSKHLTRVTVAADLVITDAFFLSRLWPNR